MKKNKIIRFVSPCCLSIAVFLCFSLALQAEASSPQKTAVREDYERSWFVRSLTGVGAADFTLEKKEQKFNSIVYHTSLHFGWVVWRNLILYSGFDYVSTASPAEISTEEFGILEGQSAEIDQSLKYNYATFVAGGSYYIFPPILYVGVDVRVAIGGSYTVDRSFADPALDISNSEALVNLNNKISPRVVGVGIALGREWLVNDHLAMGIAFHYSLDILFAQVSTNAGLSAQNSYYSFNLSISYNH